MYKYRFEKKDLFVAWHYTNNINNKKKKKNDEPTMANAANNELEVKQDEKKREDKVYLRFYHVFESQELEDLFESVPDAQVIESYYEQGNWCAIFQKI